jgi:hypothetical protein
VWVWRKCCNWDLQRAWTMTQNAQTVLQPPFDAELNWPQLAHWQGPVER